MANVVRVNGINNPIKCIRLCHSRIRDRCSKHGFCFLAVVEFKNAKKIGHIDPPQAHSGLCTIPVNRITQFSRRNRFGGVTQNQMPVSSVRGINLLLCETKENKLQESLPKLLS
jgi:hypothetical protein